MKEPKVDVGILSGPQIEFILPDAYRINGERVTGRHQATYQDGAILWNGGLHKELLFEPAGPADQEFELLQVTIGINFHWERQEDQRFQGSLRILVENEQLTTVNIVPVEQYLTSVISSEMSATASLELLKAHAVISRSWLLANLEKLPPATPRKIQEEEGMRMVWYDRESHTNYHVCADDHCQRYQGITRASTPIVRQAIAETWGEVLTYDGQICDARFSKCCGGVLEEFPTCWEETDFPYLRAKRDSLSTTNLPDLHKEEEAVQWILASPEAFCNTGNPQILSQVLNNYDRETTHFYRWQVRYTQAELATLLRERSGIDFGEIQDLIPVKRGSSGRIYQLKIVGSRRTLIVGKELEIRRILSSSHLYSSAFVVEKEYNDSDLPQTFLLKGAGWGHGVGLCQIGAAVMGEKGYRYNEILFHYYPKARIDKLYLHDHG